MAHPPDDHLSLAAGQPTTVPEQLSLALIGLAAGGLVVRQLTGSIHPGFVCPLRALTGVPCPMCGSTTSASALLELRFGDALASNPFLPSLALLATTVAVVAGGRRAGIVATARPWDLRRRRRASVLTAGAVVASWLWQLVRFGWL